MALSKREKIIAISLGGLLLALAANSVLVGPYLAQRSQLVNDIDAITAKNAEANKVMTNRPRVSENWKTMIANGLKTNGSDADITLVHAITDWGQRSRVAIDSTKSEQSEQAGDFQKVRVTVTMEGNMAGIAQWLWSLETSPLPVQVGDIQLNTRKDGVDDLNMQVTVTTVAYVPQPPKIGNANNTAGAK